MRVTHITGTTIPGLSKHSCVNSNERLIPINTQLTQLIHRLKEKPLTNNTQSPGNAATHIVIDQCTEVVCYLLDTPRN
jgi:hypothetical protein